jgi:hypothetical protein
MDSELELFSLIRDVVLLCPERLHQIGREIVTHARDQLLLDTDLVPNPEITAAYAFLCEGHALPARRRRAEKLHKRLRFGAQYQPEGYLAQAIGLGLRLDALPQKGRAATYLSCLCRSATWAVAGREDIPRDPPLPTGVQEREWQWQYLEAQVDKRRREQMDQTSRMRASTLAI